METGRKTINSDLIKKLSDLDCKIFKDEPLLRHTSFKIGGPADYLIEIPSEKALLEFLQNIGKEKVFIIGKGTNILFSDEGFRGIIIKLCKDFESFSCLGNILSCGAGANLASVLRFSAEKSLSGLEHCAGIPGTVGGAVFGNAGNANNGICERIKNIEVVNNGIKQIVDKSEINFIYRRSNINGIITAVNFLLTGSNENGILKMISDNLSGRKKTQPLGKPNAGCVFKNPKGFSAGKLIDEAGLKGLKIGGAQISEIHANFIINSSGAKASDVLELIRLIKNKIKEKFNIVLEEEIKIINP